MTIYDDLRQHSDPTERLDRLIEHFRDQRRAAELFEAVKMRTRQQLGLPLVADDSEPARGEDIERQLEMGLLDACRQSGTMMIQDGQIGQGWMYLRPTGDTELAKQLIDDVECTDENYDELIQVLLHEGVDIGRGLRLMLDRQGTCNSITTYQQTIVQRSRPDRLAAAKTMLHHFYGELCQAVRDDISRREAPAGDDETLLQMLDTRPDLLSGGGYHLDTTHIASVVQIAQLVEDPEDIQKAYELTQYGRRMHFQFQYPGEEPFKDFYPAYHAYYSVLRGENVEEGLRYFQTKAETLDPMQHGTAPIETYVDLLRRTGQPLIAITAATSLVPEGVPPARIMPLLLDLAKQTPPEQRSEAAQQITEFCEKRGDLLSYIATLTDVASST